jgi:hypothetical protein
MHAPRWHCCEHSSSALPKCSHVRPSPASAPPSQTRLSHPPRHRKRPTDPARQGRQQRPRPAHCPPSCHERPQKHAAPPKAPTRPVADTPYGCCIRLAGHAMTEHGRGGGPRIRPGATVESSSIGRVRQLRQALRGESQSCTGLGTMVCTGRRSAPSERAPCKKERRAWQVAPLPPAA